MAHGCSILLEDGSGTLLLEDGAHLLLEDCVPVEDTFGGWAEQATIRESEIDLVTVLLLARRRRLRLTVG